MVYTHILKYILYTWFSATELFVERSQKKPTLAFSAQMTLVKSHYLNGVRESFRFKAPTDLQMLRFDVCCKTSLNT